MKEEDPLVEVPELIKALDKEPLKDVLRYVRGVYDGVQSVKRQYGLEKEPPKGAA
jgi:hypothetical protein